VKIILKKKSETKKLVFIKIYFYRPFYEVLPNFCFPFGLGVKRIHAEKRHQIITKNYNYEDNCEVDKERYFIVTFRHQNTYNQNYGSKMLEDMNPHHILYCISILIDDYFCKVIIIIIIFLLIL
jgi:hypothetical protein